MAVAYDSSFEDADGGTTELTISCTPVGTIRGCICFVATNDVADDVTGVTAGGNAMTETTNSPQEQTVTDVGSVSAWFYGGNLGSSPFDVVVSASTGVKWGAVVLLTAAADTEVNATDGGHASAADPSDTVALGGISSFVAMGFWNSLNTEASASPLTGWTSRAEHDFTDDVAGLYTYDTVGTSDVTYGINTGAVTQRYAMIAVAVKEASGATVGPFGGLAGRGGLVGPGGLAGLGGGLAG